MKRWSLFAVALLAGAATFQFADAASSDDGWITLLDSSNKGNWSEVGKANWDMKDGAMTADKLEGKDLAYLVSQNSYKDFEIRAEFWVDEEANSGIIPYGFQLTDDEGLIPFVSHFLQAMAISRNSQFS